MLEKAEVAKERKATVIQKMVKCITPNFHE
jgi:hypothetical protein